MAEDFRQDNEYWQSKIIDIHPEFMASTFIRPHPEVDFETINRLESKELESYLENNPAYIGYKIIEFLCNCQKPMTEDAWQNSLLKCCLSFHDRSLEYSYFLYHLSIKDENICLLMQTLLTEWMEKSGFRFDIPK